jgi:DNA-directed RNA polymerase subunit RPC12/RpoP
MKQIIYKCFNKECACEFKDSNKDGLCCPKCKSEVGLFNLNPTEEELSSVLSYKELKVNTIEKEKTRTFTGKIELDTTQAKEELKEIGEQIDIVAKKYKELEKLSGKRNLARDISIIASCMASMLWIYKDDLIHAIFCLILILVIDKAYKK